MEKIDIVDQQGSFTGLTLDRDEVHRKGLWHRTVHIWIQNALKELLLQKRSSLKETHPDCWDVSCAGHLSAGDSSTTAAIRELQEELGLEVNEKELHFLFTIPQHFTSPDNSIIENELTDIYLLNREIDTSVLKIDKNELTEVRFVTVDELRRMAQSSDSSLVDHGPEYEMVISGASY